MNGAKEQGLSLFEAGLENSTLAGPSGREATPGAVMKSAHREKLQFCDTLEKIADSLPEVDRRKCLGTANAIVPLLRSIHQYEERIIFPAYEVASDGSNANLASARRLRAEHVEDECFAGEVTEILLAIGRGETVENAKAVGFMLRGFFKSVRRHIAFEREHVLPMIGIIEAG